MDNKFFVGKRVSSLEIYNAVGPITGIALVVDENSEYIAGDDSGYMLEVDCPFGTQAMADALLASLSGKTYRGYRADAAELAPEAELGDGITVGDVYSMLAYRSVGFGPGHMSEIAAPGENEVDHEYQYQSKIERDLKRKITQGTFYHGVAVSRENGLVVQKTNGEEIAGEAIFNSDVLAMRAVIDGVMKDCIYFDTAAQKYRLSGDVLIDGSMQSDAVVTDALYAEQGDIAQLTVDWIDTSKRVQKYLNKDTSSDFHFVGHDTTIEFIRSDVIMSGSTPQTEQMQNRYGNLLYWQKDISDAEIVNGYPYVDDLRVYITTEDTGYPVMVYQYNNHVMRQISFQQDTDSGNWFPTDLYGMGFDEKGLTGRGKILKTNGAFELTYTTTAGVVTGVYMRDDGFVDVVHRRADITVDTANKQFVISPEGVLANAFTIDYAENGDTLSLTWPDGKTFKVVKS